MYCRILDLVSTYLNEMEVPQSIIESMVATGSSDIRWVDDSDNGLTDPPSIGEWIEASWLDFQWISAAARCNCACQRNSNHGSMV